MKLDKVLTRFAASSHDVVELRRLARALGSELPRERLDVLRNFRHDVAHLAQFETAPGDADSPSYASGYVAGMLDVVAEYETCVRQREDTWMVDSMMLHRDRQRVLMALRKGPSSPAELAVELGLEYPLIARLMNDLSASGLVRPHSFAGGESGPEAYRLTNQGRRMLMQLEPGLSSDMIQGIRTAIRLFQHLLTHETSSAAALDDVANEVLPEPHTAALAVDLWASEAMEAGLVAERSTASCSDGIPRAILAEGSEPTAGRMSVYSQSKHGITSAAMQPEPISWPSSYAGPSSREPHWDMWPAAVTGAIANDNDDLPMDMFRQNLGVDDDLENITGV